MIGRVYLEHGRPVRVLAAWRPVSRANPLEPAPEWLVWHRPPASAPRNVAVLRAGGEVVVRPARGLRRPR